MITISDRAQVYTVIARIVTKPEDQEKFVNLLKVSIRGMKKHPGFVSASVHKSADGKTVLNYMQWRSQAHFEEYIQRPGRAEAESEFRKIHVETGKVVVERGAYEVVQVVEKDG